MFSDIQEALFNGIALGQAISDYNNGMIILSELLFSIEWDQLKDVGLA